MSKATNTNVTGVVKTPAQKDAALKEVNSTESAEAQAEATEKQVEAVNAQTPVGIDFTDPDQRKSDEDEARAQNEKDFAAGKK